MNENPPTSAGDIRDMQAQSWGQKIPWRRGLGNPLQYSCLENPMDVGAW